MNPWLYIWFFFAAVYYLIDFLVRRRKWNENTKQEKTSILTGMVCIAFYVFFSALGFLIGIVGPGSSLLSQILYKTSVFLGATTWLVVLLVSIASIVLRKRDKVKASLYVHGIGMGMVAVQVLLMLLEEIF